MLLFHIIFSIMKFKSRVKAYLGMGERTEVKEAPGRLGNASCRPGGMS